jgi:hypothetical protein
MKRTILIVVAVLFPLLLIITGCTKPVSYSGKIDAIRQELMGTTVYFNDGSSVFFQGDVKLVIGDEYRLVVNDKHLESLIHLEDGK